jgi:hypothetical protein
VEKIDSDKGWDSKNAFMSRQDGVVPGGPPAHNPRFRVRKGHAGSGVRAQMKLEGFIESGTSQICATLNPH